ncbi:MAG TPA: DNA polymerase IV [Solirubrobacterales bacterium]|nr:DNA polymerase IV [Solirubrobacterales bacterium]
MPSTVAHLDMDAFFASVELQRRPQLRGKPVVVANNRSRAVVAAASYDARRFGIHSAMPLVTARRLCPDLITVPAEMSLYREISGEVMEILGRYSDRVEVAGLDEAYLDLSASRTPKARARSLKAEVRAVTGLVCSIGLGPNKLVAKIASDLDKPDGFSVIREGEFLERVGDRPARLLPGVGPKTAERLGQTGIETVNDLATAEPELLSSCLGPNGPSLVQRARGLDDREIEVERVRKSESRETTFGADVTDREELARTLAGLADEVATGLAAQALAGRTVTLKVRLAPFETHTRSRTLPHPVSGPAELARVGTELLRAFDPPRPVRLIGIGLSSLEPLGSPEAAASAVPPDQDGALRLPI